MPALPPLELNQKFTKHSLKTLDTRRLHGEKHLCKTLGVKEGGGRLLEGGIFSGSYGTTKTKLEFSKLFGYYNCVTVFPTLIQRTWCS